MRQFPVHRGLAGPHDDPLRQAAKEAVPTLDEKPYRLVRHEPSERLPEVWVLTDDEETPLTCVVQPLRFSLQVTDSDEQQLERPLEGSGPDSARSAAADRGSHAHALRAAGGQPTIYFRASTITPWPDVVVRLRGPPAGRYAARSGCRRGTRPAK